VTSALSGTVALEMDSEDPTGVLIIIISTFIYVGLEVFVAENLKNAIFWDVAPFGFIINRRFGGTCRLHLQGRRKNTSKEK
jgi:hypothetical protein